jgi:hypothetical protein
MDSFWLVAHTAPREPRYRAADRDGPRPIVIANPVTDRQFRAVIDGYLAAGGRVPDELEAALRTRWPHAVVRRRELAGERTVVWYAYREGHWIGGVDDDET